MKKIEELYQEILQDDALKAEFVEAAKDNQIEAFLQKNDCNATLPELQEFAEKMQSERGSLSDTELDVAAGGFSIGKFLISVCSLGIACTIMATTSTELGAKESPKDDDDLFCSERRARW